MKHILALILPLLILLSPVPAAYAEELPIRIDSVEDFLHFCDACAEESYSAGKCFELTADLDLSNTAFHPVPYFAGRFLGNHCLITGLDVTGEGSRLGLFRRVAEGAEIRELTVRGTVAPGGTGVHIGGIAGENAGSIRSCSFEGSVCGIENVGGIAGTNTSSGRIEGCRFSGSVTAEHQVGGIAGRNDGQLLSCKNSGDINTASVTPKGEMRFDLSAIHEDDFLNLANIGGIAGDNNGTIRSCVNRGPVGYKREGFNVGGVAGKSAGFVCDCSNSAAITGRRDVGGVIGQLTPYAVWDFSNGRLDDLESRLLGMQNVLDTLRRNARDFSNDIANELLLMNDYTRSALDAVGDLLWKTVENERIMEASLQYDGENAYFDFYADSLWDLDVDTEALNAALANMRGEAQFIASLAGQGLTNAANDLNAVAKQMDAVFNSLRSSLNSTGALSTSYDLSESEAYTRDTGAAAGCRNTGCVDAENNAGGVVGTIAFELDFDMDNRLNASDFLTRDARHYLFAAVRACQSYGAVTVKEAGAGCIAGSVDIGTLIDCVGAGEARSQGGDYVGGVVGTSKGSVVSCWSRAVLSGQKYVGGIAGLGTDLRGCRSWAYIDSAGEYQGAVAGWADGTVSENLYVSGVPDGVDGVSRLGQTARITAEELLSLNGAPRDFDRITVTFLLPDKIKKQVEVPFGGSIDTLPEVPNRNAAFWRWDDFDAAHIYFSTTVEGRYYEPGSTLSTGEDVPRFLVEGVFYEGQRLNAADYTAPLPAAEIIRAATLYVNDYNEPLTVRMQAAEDGVLYRVNGAGELETIASERDGSYLVFPLENGGTVVYAKRTEAERKPWLLPAAAAAGTVTVLVLVFRARKKRKAAAATDNGSK